jgi:hypothetical protein
MMSRFFRRLGVAFKKRRLSRAIRRLSDNRKIGAVDHAEIVADSVAEPLPMFGTTSATKIATSLRVSLIAPLLG